MNWVQQIRQKYSRDVFDTRIKKVHFPHNFVDLKKANKLGFIVNVDLFTSRDLITFTDYISKQEEQGKKAFLIELNFKNKSESIFSESTKTVFINPSNINWLGFPSAQKMQEINGNEIDILMNLDNSERLTSRYICGLSNAKTRVGLSEEGFENFYELMLQLPLDSKLKEMLTNFEDYLKMLEK